ncbi:MAG: molybdopterin-dependent oxidoreductase, partial [Candidatus Dormibacteraeota bacterium]|nr:molybdopterin-dependent oxidoreductase [Candidatus Dormibacteraeota bacterium]MBO0760765.1 molybdopterin-dependent oxidoreductase [Candidatus Dormibacteraeota bacterium]
MEHSGRGAALIGLAAGLAAVGAMELAGALAALRPLPDLLQGPVLAAMPGPVFGFMIDRLQHLGKVLEEIGLLLLMVVVLALLAAAALAVADRYAPRHPRAPLLAFPAAAFVAWLAVSLAVLPVGGEGLLGLGAGPIRPVAWAIVFGIYGGTVAILASSRPAPAPAGGAADPVRRQVLALGITAVGLLVVGFTRVPGWVGAVASPPEGGQAGRLSPALTPVDRFYIVSKNFQDPQVGAGSWSLSVDGLAGSPQRLSLAQLRSLPAVTETVTLECISNVVGGAQMSTGRFTGVPLRDLVGRAQPRAEARAVNFQARDGYTESMWLSELNGNPAILVAYLLDGQPLPDAHGYPARVLVPGHYGMRGPKWLEQITLAQDREDGYWEQQGWNPDVEVRTTSRIDEPADGAGLRRGLVTVAGVAFAGGRGIGAVEWSADGGQTWRPARLE